MAEIICTVNDFHKYMGPRVRNIIQSMTKEKKKELNHICQKCNQKKELEAAHIKGNSRKNIIEMILKRCITNEGDKIMKIDLEKFEKEIIEAHKPIDKYFLFLCAKCHVKYDSDKSA